MLYVVDASVLIKWLVPEPLSDRAEGLAIAFRRGELDLVAPDIVAAEVGHSLRRLVLRDALDATEDFDAIADFLTLAVPTVPSTGLVPRAARLAVDQMASFYDALYLSLAIESDAHVVTADDRMANAFAPLDRVVRLADLEL